MLRTGHRSTQGVRSYKRTTTTLKEKTSHVLNDCTNTVKVSSTDMEEPVFKKPKVVQEMELKPNVNTKNTGNCFYFTSSSSITLNFS